MAKAPFGPGPRFKGYSREARLRGIYPERYIPTNKQIIANRKHKDIEQELIAILEAHRNKKKDDE